MKARIIIELTELNDTSNNYGLSQQIIAQVPDRILKFINDEKDTLSATIEMNFY